MVDELSRLSVEDEVTARAPRARGARRSIDRRRTQALRSPGRIRTLALTGMGAAIFTLVSIHGFEGRGASTAPARLAAQVAAGVGSIGAGTHPLRWVGPRPDTATAIRVAVSLGVAAATGLYGA